MTFLEIVIVLGIVGLLAAIAVPTYADYRYRALVAQAKSDIIDIGVEIARFQSDNVGQLPDDLAGIGKDGLLDPWGSPYKYLKLVDLVAQVGVRKNKNLVPINSDYDLYSMGPDGDSKGPLTAKASRDDIIRANNGRFVGVASAY